MLRETAHIKTYPNKSVIEDLVTRTGDANENSYSPFVGLQNVLKSQFKGTHGARFKLNEFLKYCKERDLNPSRLTRRTKVGLVETKEGVNAGFLTLEDIINEPNGNDYANAYLVQMCAGFRTDNTSPFRTNTEYITRNVVRYDDDGDSIVEEKYLIERVDYDNISNERYEQIITELPHIIKTIWSYSKEYQANLFSFAFAYADILTKKSSKSITTTDFMTYTTYLIKSDGTYERPFNHGADNKYKIYPRVLNIFKYPGNHRAEYDIIMKFLNYIKELGIDYRDEDAMVYNNDFIDRLKCTYLPPNSEYFDKYSSFDIEIQAALNPANIFSTTKGTLVSSSADNNVDYNYTIDAVNAMERVSLAYKFGSIPKHLFLRDKTSAFNLIGRILSIESGGKVTQVPEGTLQVSQNGLICSTDKVKVGNRMVTQENVFVLPGKYFGEFLESSAFPIILTEYQFAILLDTETGDVYYATLEDCYRLVEEYEECEKVCSKTIWNNI